jgi:dTDP-4-dehydrorhamnose reductase
LKKKVLITGANGQLGVELQSSAPDWAEVFPTDETELDITDLDACIHEIESLSPSWIINAAAFTDVEKAESEAGLATKVNHIGPENLARAARNTGAGLVHISTDFVFDGKKKSPYFEDDQPCPVNIYGSSKLAGEQAVTANLFEKAIIIRTSWLYSATGKNFVKTILRLLNEKPALNIVGDQIGVPTSVRSLAQVVYRSIELELTGLFHWCDAGECSWYEFACEIQDQAIDLGLIGQRKEITPIGSIDFPAKAKRPAYSVMSQKKLAKATRVDPLPWQNELRLVLQALAPEKS